MKRILLLVILLLISGCVGTPLKYRVGHYNPHYYGNYYPNYYTHHAHYRYYPVRYYPGDNRNKPVGKPRRYKNSRIDREDKNKR